MSQGIESLPLPDLEKRICSGIPVLTDQVLFDRLGLRIAFTSRVGGVSEGAYASLNLSDRVGDDATAVTQNRALLCEVFEADLGKLVVPKQVHGVKIVSSHDAHVHDARINDVHLRDVHVCTHDAHARTALAAMQQGAEAGADAVLVSEPDVPVLLCFADCVPLILAAPSGSFVVVHAGWRGALAGIAGNAVCALLDVQAQAQTQAGTGCEASMLNAYIGPYIHAECFECDAEVASRFAEAYGRACVPDESHVDLGAALRCDLTRAGVSPERIADANLCTVCNNESYFSYRAQDGCAGRHGAFAVWQGDCA